MAIFSVSGSLPILHLRTSSRPKSTLFSFHSNLSIPQTLNPQTFISSTFYNFLPSAVSASAAPESVESLVPSSLEVEDSEIPASVPFSLGADVDMMAPKQKIRIKLKSYWVPLIEDSCKQIMDVARATNAKTMGPVPLPTKKRIYCLLKSPHVHKDARFHFEIRTHQRLIDILYPTAQTIDSLMQLDLPAGVDVNVKL